MSLNIVDWTNRPSSKLKRELNFVCNPDYSFNYCGGCVAIVCRPFFSPRFAFGRISFPWYFWFRLFSWLAI